GLAFQPGQGVALAPGDVVRLGQTSLQLVTWRPAYLDATPAETTESSEDNYAAYLAEATGESNGFLPDEVSEADLLDGASGDMSLPQSASSTHLLSPGITLQFAFRGRFKARMWWLLGIGAALVLLVCTVVTLGTAVLVGRGALATEGAASVLAALTIPLVPALGVAIVTLTLDRYEREPWSLMLGAFLWGALIAIAPALFLERRLVALLES